MYLFEDETNQINIDAGRTDEMIYGFDYLAESAITNSNTFDPENVGVIEFTNCLSQVIHAAQRMDKFKKALFRKRSREEAQLDLMEPQPLLSEAIAGYAMNVEGLFHGIVGGITEMGELAEVLYDFLAANKEPDLTNVREEIGDNLWYLACLMRWADTTPLTEMKRNIAKLRLRHGSEGFDKDRDIVRDLVKERFLLEGVDPRFEAPTEGD